MTQRLTLVRPDDWHLHLRDGAMLQAVLPESARHFARALVMPNLVPPVVTAAQAGEFAAMPPAALKSSNAAAERVAADTLPAAYGSTSSHSALSKKHA